MIAGTDTNPPPLPGKTREVRNHTLDSTAWNDFTFRADDIVIATYSKSGTTWMQQIIAQLLSGGSEDTAPAEASLWLDYRILDRAKTLAALQAQTGRRYMKTHLPADALAYAPDVKYIYIARDGRDVVWSAYHHYTMTNDATFAAINNPIGREGPPMPRIDIPVRDYFLQWLERDGYPIWPFWDHVRTWWRRRDLPNVLLVHHHDLTHDLRGEIARIAGFLGIPVEPSRWDAIVRHCSIRHMQARADDVVPRKGASFIGGAPTFLANGGVNGRWRDVLTAEDTGRYEATAQRELGGECAAWLEGGRKGRD